MGEPKASSGDELVLVRCSVDARRGVPFDLLVTDRQLAYGRGRRRVAVALDAISDAALRKKTPWLAWSAGTLIVLVLAGYGWMMATDPSLHYEFRPLLLAGAAIALFVGGRDRWVLGFRAGGRRHKIVQPLTSDLAKRAAMAASLKEAAALVADPHALAARVFQVQQERD